MWTPATCLMQSVGKLTKLPQTIRPRFHSSCRFAILVSAMLRQSFTDFIFATNTDGSGKAASYVRVFYMLGPILTKHYPKPIVCGSMRHGFSLADIHAVLTSVPWGHHMLTIDKCHSQPEKALFYVRSFSRSGTRLSRRLRRRPYWNGTIACSKKPLRLRLRNICGDETEVVL